MDTFRSDEEQVEALKNWWQENGVSTLVSIGVAIAIIFGWRTWQGNQQAYVDNASFSYQQLLEAVAQLETNGNDIQIATVDHMAETIKADYSETGYSHFAAFFKARQAVEDNDLPAAEEELGWILANKPNAEMQLITELRLAKVLFAQQQTDAALALLNRSDTGAFTHAFLELKGDLLVNTGDHQGAFDAFTQSKVEIEALGMSEPQTLTVKTAYAKSFL